MKDSECYFCDKCTSPREVNPCWKCNSETRVARREYVELHMPDVNQIKRLCFDMGYCAVIHGSKERDLDVIAVPWVENAVVPRVLIQHLADNLLTENGKAKILAIQEKPHGRTAATIQMDGIYKPIDLSITPMANNDFASIKTALRVIENLDVIGLPMNAKIAFEMDAGHIHDLQRILRYKENP